MAEKSATAAHPCSTRRGWETGSGTRRAASRACQRPPACTGSRSSRSSGTRIRSGCCRRPGRGRVRGERARVWFNGEKHEKKYEKITLASPSRTSCSCGRYAGASTSSAQSSSGLTFDGVWGVPALHHRSCAFCFIKKKSTRAEGGDVARWEGELWPPVKLLATVIVKLLATSVVSSEVNADYS